MTFTDAVGARHAPDPAARIVSLVPSITELLCDLGLAAQVVGRTGFCIHPADIVAAIPKVGGTKDVNIEKIRKLAPTHLVVNIDENEKPTVEALAEFVPHIVVTHPLAPRDNLDAGAPDGRRVRRRARRPKRGARSSRPNTRRCGRRRKGRRRPCCTASGRIRGWPCRRTPTSPA